MSVPQPVLSPLTKAAIFLVLTIDEGGEDGVRDVLSDVPALQRTVGFRVPEGRLAVVAGIGSDAWDRLFSGPRPAELWPFRELRGDRHHAPSTPGDLLLHIRAQQMDLCFEFAALAVERLRGSATVVDEVHGFVYFEERDLLGFVDGTENPAGPDAAEAVTIGDEDEAFAGGSYVVIQKYVHDLAAWNALTMEEQELVIGRTKLANVELPDEDKPADSHVAVNTVTGPDGEELDVVRDNMPFGAAAGEVGTYYIAYSKSPTVSELMLRRMFIGEPPGSYDRILDFSTALTGSQYHVPTIDFLESPPPPPGSAPRVAATAADRSGDGSLGLGGLRGGGTQGDTM